MDAANFVLEPGTLVGAYRVIKPIGRGGMGVVWLAEHVLIGRRAAIKILRTSCTENEELVTRFFNEARAAAAISDPGIVQVFDFGYHTDGSAYLVMELLDGEPLDKRLERTGVMAVGDALRTMRQVATSLGAAHARNIVHRDLKPENLFVVRDPEVAGGERAKILDFGIAKLSDDPGAKKTDTLALMGTPMFMSPEQCRGSGLVDARTDVYAVGCVLFTLLAGAPPFDAVGVGELIAKHIYEIAPRVSSVMADCPAMVDALVARCLAKDPADRYANGSELAAAIGGIISNGFAAFAPASTASTEPLELTTQAIIHPTARGERKPGTTLSASAMALAELPPRKRSLVLAGLGIAVTVLGAGGAYFALRPAADATPIATTTPAPTPVERPTAQPLPVPAPPTDQRAAATDRQLAIILGTFAQWAAQHPTSGCPTARELATFSGLEIVDPWGHEIAVTCTAQPADQTVGAISAGPDGLLGSDDDQVSWRLGPDVTRSVRGPRWAPAHTASPSRPSHATASREPVAAAAVHDDVPVPAPTPTPAPKPTPHHEPTTRSSFHGTPLGSDGIPTRR